MAKNNNNKEVSALPKELRDAFKGFTQTRPDASTPKFLMDIFRGSEDDEEFSIELNENKRLEIAEWAFTKQGKEIPDSIDGVDYLEQVKIFAGLIYKKIFLFNYDTGTLKPCPFYSENEKIKVVGLRDRTRLNTLCAEQENTKDKAEIYAKHYGVEDEFNNLYEWEKSLFYVFCSENKASNTKVGKN